MQISWMWKLVGLGCVAVGIAASSAGCSDDPTPLAPVVSGQQCGSTVASMKGASCTGTASCSVPLTCGTEERQVSVCTCDGATFSCKGPDGVTDFDGEGEPACLPLPSANPPECGSSLDALNNTECTVAKATCHFAAEKCPGETVGEFDTCDCKQNTVDSTKFNWVCTKNTCDTGNLFPDSGTSSSGGQTDAGADAAD